ncbi:MAG: SMC-Scp complex subunit ScpB, partial [Calditrichaeota bacterium]|nr:SMC-Scp complex subunit ScpB [Calditrichota bacterium]
IKKAVQALNEWYRESGRAFQVEEVAGGFQMFTLPQYAEYVERMYAKRQQNRLSPKALETLAIVAYKQPITRLEIEEIRGVNVDGVMKTLLSRNLITISGTASTPGNPFIYKTTRKFLEYFGLKSLKDLPRLKELDEIVEADSEIQEKFGEAFFKEIAPEILGMKENELSENNEVDETNENEQDAEKPT